MLAAEHRVLNQLAAHRPFVPAPLAFTLQDGTVTSLLSYLERRNMVEAIDDAEVSGRRTL